MNDSKSSIVVVVVVVSVDCLLCVSCYPNAMKKMRMMSSVYQSDQISIDDCAVS